MKTNVMIRPDQRCRNCSQHLLLHQRFCHSCGQRTDTHRIDFHYFIHEIPHSIFHVDGGIIFTLKELFTRPGHSIREFLEGKRQPHFKPLLLVIIMGSLCALLQLFFAAEKPKSSVETDLGTERTEVARYVDIKGFIGFVREITDWLTQHFAFTILLILPVTALAFFLGFRKYRVNYFEWLVIFLFLAGQSLAVYLFFILVNEFAGDFTFLYFLVITGLITFSLVQFFEERGKWYVMLRAAWAFFLSYVFFVMYLLVAILLALVVGAVRFGTSELVPVLMEKL